MRRVIRQQLIHRAERYLRSSQRKIDDGADIENTWTRARRTKTIQDQVFSALENMAGTRRRCMYCNDSRGTDIEHFWPKNVYPQYTFRWENMLLACTGCNRRKGDRFPIGDDGQPLLIDPSVDDPWHHMAFIPETGQLAERWLPDKDQFDPKATATLDPQLLPLNIEAVTTGRQRTYRHLVRAFQRFLENVDGGMNEGDACAELIASVVDSIDFGLDRWIVLFEGQRQLPFSDVAARFPDCWQEVTALVGE